MHTCDKALFCPQHERNSRCSVRLKYRPLCGLGEPARIPTRDCTDDLAHKFSSHCIDGSRKHIAQKMPSAHFWAKRHFYPHTKSLRCEQVLLTFIGNFVSSDPWRIESYNKISGCKLSLRVFRTGIKLCHWCAILLLDIVEGCSWTFGWERGAVSSRAYPFVS